MTLSYQHLDIDVPVTTDRKSFFKLYNLRPCISGTSIYKNQVLCKRFLSFKHLKTMFTNHMTQKHSNNILQLLYFKDYSFHNINHVYSAKTVLFSKVSRSQFLLSIYLMHHTRKQFTLPSN